MPFPSRNLRILILLLILLFVAADTWVTQARTTSWKVAQWLVVYPINGDGSQTAEDYIRQLQEQDFADIEEFYSQEAKRYGLALDKPIEVKLAQQVKEQPPAIPVGGSRLDIILWSLKLRYWGWQNDNYDGPGDLKLFVRFFDPNQHPVLGHSTGLRKGGVGIVSAYASKKQRRQNNFVIAHELAHLFGATDKYDLSTNIPIHPQGYAEPDRNPLYPQNLAELMGGRVPLSPTLAQMPASLKKTRIGPATATEIRWLNGE